MRNIFKLLLLLLPLTILTSCGDADPLKAPSQILDKPEPLKASYTANDVDPDVRSVTLIAYPNADELQGIDYQVSDQAFDGVFGAKTTAIETRDVCFQGETEVTCPKEDEKAQKIVKKSLLFSNGNELKLEEKTVIVTNSLGEEEERTIEFVTGRTDTDLVSYYTSMPNGLDSSLAADMNLSNIVMQLINVGQVRDESLRDYIRLKNIKKPYQDKFTQVEEGIKNIQFYRIKKGEFKRQFVIREIDGLDLKDQNTKDCNQLERRVDKLAIDGTFNGEPLVTEEEKKRVFDLLDDCNSLDQAQINIEIVELLEKEKLINSANGLIDPNSSFYLGKQYVTNLLDYITIQMGKTFLSTGVYKESRLDGSALPEDSMSKIELESVEKVFKTIEDAEAFARNSKLTIVDIEEVKKSDAADINIDIDIDIDVDGDVEVDVDVNSENDRVVAYKVQLMTFKTFSLTLDLLGSGKGVVYSVKNGAITNLEISMMNDVRRITFDLSGKDKRGIDVIVRAELGESSDPNLGVRYVGDAEFFFANGEYNEGVMKIELDFKDNPLMVID